MAGLRRSSYRPPPHPRMPRSRSRSPRSRGTAAPSISRHPPRLRRRRRQARGLGSDRVAAGEPPQPMARPPLQACDVQQSHANLCFASPFRAGLSSACLSSIAQQKPGIMVPTSGAAAKIRYRSDSWLFNQEEACLSRRKAQWPCEAESHHADLVCPNAGYLRRAGDADFY